MRLMQVLCYFTLCTHVHGETPDCATHSYVNSMGFTCFACTPGYFVSEECKKNGTQNICAPCPDDHFQSHCTEHAKSCRKCSPCQDLRKQKVKNCTRIHDTVCMCTGYWDTSEHICVLSCPPGKYIAKGVGGEGQLCEFCKNGTFSSVENASKCQQCRNCSDYNKNCSKTSDAVCNHLTTRTMDTTTNGAAATTIGPTTTTKKENCKYGCKEPGCTPTEIVIIVVVVVLMLPAHVVLFLIWQKKVDIRKYSNTICRRKFSRSNNQSSRGNDETARTTLLLHGQRSVTQEDHERQTGQRSVTQEDHERQTGQRSVTQEDHARQTGQRSVTQEDHARQTGQCSVTQEDHERQTGQRSVTQEDQERQTGQRSVTQEDHERQTGQRSVTQEDHERQTGQPSVTQEDHERQTGQRSVTQEDQERQTGQRSVTQEDHERQTGQRSVTQEDQERQTGQRSVTQEDHERQTGQPFVTQENERQTGQHSDFRNLLHLPEVSLAEERRTSKFGLRSVSY